MSLIKSASAHHNIKEMEEWVKQSGYNVIIFIRVKPLSVKNEIFLKPSLQPLNIRLKSPAREGKANKELISFLSSLLKIAKEKINIKSGLRSKNKVILLRDINLNIVKERLKVFL